MAVTSLFDGATLPLLEQSISAISDAAPAYRAREQQIEVRNAELVKQADEVAKRLNLSQTEAESVFKSSADSLEGLQVRTSAQILAPKLRRSEADVESALLHLDHKNQGNLGAVQRLGLLCILVVLLYGCRYWFTRGQAFYLSKAAARLSSDMRERLFAKLQSLPVSYFGEKRVGAIQSVLTNDINVYQNAVGIIRDSIDAPIKALIAFGYILLRQWELAGVTLLFLPPMAFVIDRNGRKMRSSQGRVQDDMAELGASTNESLQGMRVIKAFSAEKQIQSRYRELVEKTFQSQMEATRRYAALRPLVEMIGACALAAVLYICGWLSFLGHLGLGQIAALIFALDRINQGFRSLGNVSSTYNQVQAAVERIHGEVIDVPDQAETEGATTIDHPRGRIEFRNVTFRYPDGTEALKNVSFILEPGRSLALVGPSGAGKSTIADLLLRFHDPSEGQILLDGEDLRQLKLEWLRNQIGVVPQHTFLFAGTVSDNIRMGKPDADHDEIVEAARMAHVDEFVHQLESGYDSEIGEGGSRISGGQRQRLAIARALVRKPTLLLLDEATSALDATSEKAVTEALDEVMRQRTTLFIAHRLTTAARADSILVLSKGEVVESGSHQSLIEANGAYAGLFRAFSGGILG